MNNTLTTVALRYRALYLDIRREDINLNSEATAPTEGEWLLPERGAATCAQRRVCRHACRNNKVHQQRDGR